MAREHGRICGLNTVIVDAANGARWNPGAQSILLTPTRMAQPPLSGVVRVWWRVSSVITAGLTSNPPRVQLSWSVQDEAARGNLLNPATPSPPGLFDPASSVQPPSMLCDAWYGEIELSCTSISLQAGWAPGEAASGVYVVQSTITEGGTGATEYATFSRHVALAGAPVKVFVPGATATLNNGAHRARTIAWMSGTVGDVVLEVTDFIGNAIQIIRTGAVPAPAPYTPLVFDLHPSAYAIGVTSAVAMPNAFVMFRYF